VWASGCLGMRAAGGTCRIAAKRLTLTGGAGRMADGSTCPIAAKRLTLTGGADRVGVRMPGAVGSGQHQPDRGQAASARSCGHRVAGMPDRGGYAHVAHVATPVHLATGTRLPAVNAIRANMGDMGGNGGVVGSPCRTAAKRLTLTGGADPVGVRMPGDAWGAWPTVSSAIESVLKSRMPAAMCWFP